MLGVWRKVPESDARSVPQYSGRVKSPEWRRQLRRADVRQFQIFRHGPIIIYTRLPAGGTYYPICMFPTNSERLIGFSAFVYGYPSSCPRAHCTPNKSVTTLRYTRRHGPALQALTECNPLDFRRSSIMRSRHFKNILYRDVLACAKLKRMVRLRLFQSAHVPLVHLQRALRQCALPGIATIILECKCTLSSPLEAFASVRIAWYGYVYDYSRVQMYSQFTVRGLCFSAHCLVWLRLRLFQSAHVPLVHRQRPLLQCALPGMATFTIILECKCTLSSPIGAFASVRTAWYGYVYDYSRVQMYPQFTDRGLCFSAHCPSVLLNCVM